MKLVYVITAQVFAIFSTIKFSSVKFCGFFEISFMVVFWLDYENESLIIEVAWK